MATLSTTAWVLHELGLAAGFGSNLFGQLALSPAVKEIQSKRERGKVSHVALDRYSAVNGTSLVLMAGTWFAGRLFANGREVSKGARALTITKDILVGAAVVGGVASIAFGKMLDRERTIMNEPLTVKSRPSAETRKRVADLERVTRAFGIMSTVLEAAVLATTTVLAMKAGRSAKWKGFSRLLP
jgi:hypothetical protein